VTAPFAREAVLPPGAWVEISKEGTKTAESPLNDLPPLEENSAVDLSVYSSYRNQFPETKPSADAKPLRIAAKALALPDTVSLTSAKQSVEGASITGWDQPQTTITAKVNIPESGWYQLKARYCAQGSAVRSILIGGALPFSLAAATTFPSTLGDPPSDGWSNNANDWKEIILGATTVPGGWKFYLPRGETTLGLRNEDGVGCNLNWLELVPVAK